MQVCIPSEGVSEATGWCKDLCPGDTMDLVSTGNNAMSEADARDVCTTIGIDQGNELFFNACVMDMMVPPHSIPALLGFVEH